MEDETDGEEEEAEVDMEVEDDQQGSASSRASARSQRKQREAQRQARAETARATANQGRSPPTAVFLKGQLRLDEEGELRPRGMMVRTNFPFFYLFLLFYFFPNPFSE